MIYANLCKSPAKSATHITTPHYISRVCCLCRLRPKIEYIPLCFGCRELYESGVLSAHNISSSREEYTSIKGLPYLRRHMLDISKKEVASIARYSYHPTDPKFILTVRSLLKELHRCAAQNKEVPPL